MTNKAKSVTILLADDDAEDRKLTIEACAQCRFANTIEVVENGQQVLDYLRGEGDFSDRVDTTHPRLVLLDLRMPRMDGFETLAAMKSDPDLRKIPVVILTTSEAEEDIIRSYDLGVNSFISKPVTFDALVRAVNTLGTYWFELVELPA